MSENRSINMGSGNYNERIEGNYYDYRVNYVNDDSSEQTQGFPEICRNQKSLKKYLQSTRTRLKEQFGCIDIKNNMTNPNFKLVARNPNFDMSIGFFPTRGEAFFIFSEFERINFSSLRAFATHCLNYARAEIDRSTVGNAVYNLKFPSNLCFAVALIDEIDTTTSTSVKSINPLRDKVDSLWYEIPVVYELNNQQLYFYEKPLNWVDKFTGEIAWKEIRKIIQEALILESEAIKIEK